MTEGPHDGRDVRAAMASSEHWGPPAADVAADVEAEQAKHGDWIAALDAAGNHGRSVREVLIAAMTTTDETEKGN